MKRFYSDDILPSFLHFEPLGPELSANEPPAPTVSIDAEEQDISLFNTIPSYYQNICAKIHQEPRKTVFLIDQINSTSHKDENYHPLHFFTDRELSLVVKIHNILSAQKAICIIGCQAQQALSEKNNHSRLLNPQLVLDKISPDIIITVGANATKALLGSSVKVSQVKYRLMECLLDKKTSVIPIIHPEFLIYSAPMQTQLFAALEKLKTVIH